jgi:hypothetical protein
VCNIINIHHSGMHVQCQRRGGYVLLTSVNVIVCSVTVSTAIF